MRFTAAGSFAWRCDDLVERRLLIEHHRVQLAARRSARRARTSAAVDLLDLVAERGEPERVREPLRRIDRQDQRALAAARGRERERRRGRGLADAAGADADEDPALSKTSSQTRRHVRAGG